jgi:16S rRNA (cytosine967-C5)-methyltransferase
VIAPARQAAFEALGLVDSGAGMSGALATARASLRDARDRALVTELVSGAIRMRAAIDYQLRSRVTRDLARLDAPVLTTLRLAAFQLIYLSRVPVPAIVNDAVALTRRSGKSSAAGLVNAALRALARDRERLAWPESPPVAALATRESHPEWLVERWAQRYGEAATRAWLRHNNEPVRLCLAANRLKTTREALATRLAREGVGTEPAARAPDALIVTSGSPLSTEAYRDGWFVAQDEASQLIGDLGDLKPGGRVLDVCASPGGKTLRVAWRAGRSALVVATDVRPRRMRLLRATVTRLGLDRVRLVQIDVAAGLPFCDGAFDFVLVDAPCSGLGTIRRDPDIRWRRRPEDLPVLATVEMDLLARASRAVARGGSLVYATCSSEPEENEDVVAAFLAGHPDFRLADEHRTWPFRDRLDAFYGAALVRRPD